MVLLQTNVETFATVRVCLAAEGTEFVTTAILQNDAKLQGRGRQCGICRGMVSTIHAGMRRDLDAMATKVTPLSSGDTDRQLWLRELAIVLLSTMRYCREMTFW